jgi:fructose-bisphosphate aldolase class 1
MDTAETLVANDKGLLAMDESMPTCNKRFSRNSTRSPPASPASTFFLMPIDSPIPSRIE